MLPIWFGFCAGNLWSSLILMHTGKASKFYVMIYAVGTAVSAVLLAIR